MKGVRPGTASTASLCLYNRSGLDGPPAREQIDDSEDECHDQQDVNEIAGHVESPAHQPQHDKTRDN
jgi:hypothetical protein